MNLKFNSDVIWNDWKVEKEIFNIFSDNLHQWIFINGLAYIILIQIQDNFLNSKYSDFAEIPNE